MRIIFLALFLLFVGVSNAQVSKIVEGHLEDFKTKSEADEVDVTLKSLKTGKVFKAET